MGVSDAAGIAMFGVSAALQYPEWRHAYRITRVPTLRVRDDDGTLLQLTVRDAVGTHLLDREDGDWSLRVAHRVPEPPGLVGRALGRRARVAMSPQFTVVRGDAARRALTTLIPAVNVNGGKPRVVAEAVDVIASRANLADTFLRAGDREGRTFMALDILRLGTLPAPYRLALEMSLHERDERRALDGELGELAERWRDAEEIASIADGLLLPSDVTRRLAALHDDASVAGTTAHG
jgi:hypothetical protein